MKNKLMQILNLGNSAQFSHLEQTRVRIRNALPLVAIIIINMVNITSLSLFLANAIPFKLFLILMLTGVAYSFFLSVVLVLN